MHLRVATAGDLDLVTSLRLDFLAEQRSDLSADLVAATPAFVTEHHRAGDLRSWLALDGDATLGVVSMLLRPVPPRPSAVGTTEGYLLNLYVVPHRRRAGIGQLLLDACVGHAEAAGLCQLVLHTTEDGRPMYERAGFVRADRWYELTLG